MGKLDKLLDGAQQHLDADEEVVEAVQGAYETKVLGKDSVRTGTLIATDKRLVFFAKKLTGYDLESFPYENISSFESGKAMMGGNVKFFASGNEVRMKWIKAGDFQKLVAYVRSRMGKQPAAAAPDLADQLRKLASLRDDGILSDAEFDAKKAQLLAQM